ncbi:MAG: thymidylate kinase [Candidatus Methanomethylophilaceae archaeon]|nr:thymidylate kinase [Candidatus Methanomethylophilaceae archaeon]
MVWIVVDGMDGSGKSSVAEIMERELTKRGRKVLVLTHPNTDTFVGRVEARALCIQGKAAKIVSVLAYITDVIHSIVAMKLTRRNYDDYIFVRYIMGVAYLSEKPARIAYRIFDCIFPRPEYKVLVDVEASVALERIKMRGQDLEVYETLDKLEDTRHKMLLLSDGWMVVDNNGPLDGTDETISLYLDEISSWEKL